MAGAIAALAACAPAAEQARFGGATAAQTTLVVKNENWNSFNVYLLKGAAKMRMGTVPALGQASFRIPDDFVRGATDLVVWADPIGSRETYVSPGIQVYPGAELALTLGSRLRFSTFAVYP